MSGRILGCNLLTASGIVSETTTSGYPAKNMVNGRTSNQAGFTYATTGQAIFNIGSSVNYSGKTLGIGIAKHNLGTTSATITIALSADNATYTTAATFNITEDNPQILTFTYASSFQYFRVRVTNHDSQAYLSDLTFNEVLDTRSGQPIGYVPPSRAYNDEVLANVTRGNELAGVTIIRKPVQFKINLNHIDLDYDGTLWRFLYLIVRSGAFYFKWATSDDEGIDGAVAFCWLKNKMYNVKFDSATTRGTSFDCEGFTE